MLRFVAATLVLFLLAAPSHAQEMILGRTTLAPGIQLVFEAAPKDDVTPYDRHLAEDQTDIHLEILATWAEDPDIEIPQGTVRGGFVAYLNVIATITNEATGQTDKVTLVPHVTLGDAMHYARNVSLPGARTDTYEVTFDVQPPSADQLAFHKSWRDAYGSPLFEASSFTYEGLDFAEMAAATRR